MTTVLKIGVNKMPTSLEEQFSGEFRNIFHMYSANLIQEARKLATELGVEGIIELKMEFKVRDKSPDAINWYAEIHTPPRAVLK